MKNIALKILLIMTHFIFAQNGPADQNELIGKWEITKVEIENVISAEKGKDPTLTDTSNTQSQNLINGLAQSISDEYLHSVFYFKTENQLKIKTKRKKIKGTYTFQKEKSLIFTSLDFFKELAIQKLEGNTLIINQVDDNKVITLTFTKK
jgi:hypothetical protein